MTDIIERKQWFERNKHLFSEGMQQRWLTCAYQDECFKAEIDKLRERIRELGAERAAIKLKTIEECAVICDGHMAGKLSWHERAALDDAAKTIRLMSQSHL